MRTAERFEGDPTSGGPWDGSERADGDVVVSSRIRLARNVRGHRFLIQAEAQERAQLEQMLRDALSAVSFAEDSVYVRLDRAPDLDRELLVERHLISRELAHDDGPRGVGYSADEAVSVMVCEEDHLRVQVLRPGFALEEAWDEADALDDRLGAAVDFAFSADYGFLTCCPTNLGTGLRASVMLHLPALVYSKHIEKVYHAGNKMSLAVRGLYGEGTQATGDLFQISNQLALGVTESDLLARLQRVVPRFVDYERRMRDELMSRDPNGLLDKVWRAYGALRSARRVSSEQALELLSAARLGVLLGVLPDRVTESVLNELFLLSQPAHLQVVETGPLTDSEERDVARANLIRSRLGELD